MEGMILKAVPEAEGIVGGLNTGQAVTITTGLEFKEMVLTKLEEKTLRSLPTQA